MGGTAVIIDHATGFTRCSSSLRPICGLSDPEAYADILRISGRRVVAAGETVLAKGGEASLVGTVLGGVLKISRSLPDGRERIVSLLYPGDFFGQLFIPTMDFAVEAATDVEICVADRLAYEAIIARHPGLEHAMLVTTSSALALARERSLLLSCQTTRERVATYLLVMVARRDHLLTEMKLRSHRNVAAFAISRTDLASYLGTTFETISRQIHYLVDKEVVLILDSSHFEVINMVRLQSIAGVSSDDLRLFMPTTRGKTSTRLQSSSIAHIPNRMAR